MPRNSAGRSPTATSTGCWSLSAAGAPPTSTDGCPTASRRHCCLPERAATQRYGGPKETYHYAMLFGKRPMPVHCPVQLAEAVPLLVGPEEFRRETPCDRRYTDVLTEVLTKRLGKASGSRQTRRSPAIHNGVSDGIRTRDIQDHNLAL